MNNKLLGNIALAGAPFLFIGLVFESSISTLKDSWFTGIWGIVYITAWMCSVIIMQRAQITGRSLFGRLILKILFGTLTVANISNLFWIIFPHQKPEVFFYLDLFWPLSNVIMLIVGITVLISKGMHGRDRFVPILVGIWLPFALGMLLIFGRTTVAFYIGGIYSAVAWTVLALILRKMKTQTTTFSQPQTQLLEMA